MAKSKGREVVPKGNGLPVKSVMDPERDAGGGMRHVDVDSMAMPFLKVLQKGSPEVDEASGRALKGAKEGMFYETASQRLHDGKKGVIIIPCNFRHRFIHWGPKFGQFKGNLDPETVNGLLAEETVVRVENRMYFPLNGKVDTKKCDRLVDTREHYVLLLDGDGEVERCLFPLASTQIKKSRNLITAIEKYRKQRSNGAGSYNPPSYLHRIRATTAPESNDEGSWAGVNFIFERELIPGKEDAIYEMARQFSASIDKGQVETNYANLETVQDNDNGERKRGF